MLDKDFDKLIKSIKRHNTQEKMPTKINKIQNYISMPPGAHTIFCPTLKTTTNTNDSIQNPKDTFNYLTINHMFNEHGQRQSLDQLLKSTSKNIWETA